MAYTETTWLEDGSTPITATELNRMEDGIQAMGFSCPPTDVTPSTTDSWVTVDISTHAAGKQRCAFLRITGEPSLRPSGESSTLYDEFYFDDNDYEFIVMPLNTSGEFEVLVGSGEEIHLICWF